MAKAYPKHFACVNSLRPYNSPVTWTLLLPHLADEAAETEQLGRGQSGDLKPGRPGCGQAAGPCTSSSRANDREGPFRSHYFCVKAQDF